VKRPTSRADEVSPGELASGVESLKSKIREWRPGLVLFPFVAAARAVLGPAAGPGRGPLLEGVPTFVFTGPYAPAKESRRTDAELRKIVGSPAPSSGHSEAGPEEPSLRPEPTVPDHYEAFSQRVTKAYLRRGQIRFPREAKAMFPYAKGEVEVVLRGVSVRGTYDPRLGPDRPRSAVLRLGRGALQSVRAEERLHVTRRSDGRIRLD
jgi:hypothetical protein